MLDVLSRKLEEHGLLTMEFELIEKGSLRVACPSCGFQIRELYGNYERAPFDPERSPVMIWVLKK